MVLDNRVYYFSVFDFSSYFQIKNVCKNNILQLARYGEMMIQALRLRFKRNSFRLKTIATCTDVALLSC